MAVLWLFQTSRETGGRGGGLMAMARQYLRVTHRPAALIYASDGRVSLLVVGPDLGLFAGLRLPRRVATALSVGSDSAPEPAPEQSNPPE